jgi:hypothetical protein
MAAFATILGGEWSLQMVVKAVLSLLPFIVTIH